MINIGIIDDHPLIREGFKKLIDEEVDMAVVAEASNAEAGLKLAKSSLCDVIILDISMPDKSGLEVLKEIRIVAPAIKTLILTMHAEDRFAIRALKAGAAGYLTKMSAPTELIQAIRQVSRNQKYISPGLAEKLAINIDSTETPVQHSQLSDREYEVMCLIGCGQTVSQIAEKLTLTVSTVNTYRRRILEKMHLSNNAAIMHYVISQKLIE